MCLSYICLNISKINDSNNAKNRREELGFSFKDFIYLFLERREMRKKQRERNIDVRDNH